MEGRRQVKEWLKSVGSLESHHTSFSCSDAETGEEQFVGVPEQGGRDLISLDPLAPARYTDGVTTDGTVGRSCLEVSVASGTAACAWLAA